MLRQRSFWPYFLIGIGLLIMHWLALTLWSQYVVIAHSALAVLTVILFAILALIISYSKFGIGGILRLIGAVVVRGTTDLELLLFSIEGKSLEGDYTQMLDAGVIPPAVREQLNLIGGLHKFSGNVDPLVAGELWTITDRTTRTEYTARSDGRKLHISMADEQANDSIFNLARLGMVIIFLGAALVIATPFTSAPASADTSQPGEAATTTPLAILSPLSNPATAPVITVTMPVATPDIVVAPPATPTATPIPNWRRVLDNHLFLYIPQYDRPTSAVAGAAAGSATDGAAPVAVDKTWAMGKLVLVDMTKVLTVTAGAERSGPDILVLNFGPVIDLAGWHLRLGDRYDYEFGPTRLDAGEALSVWWRAGAIPPGDEGTAINLGWGNVPAALPAQLTLATPKNVIADQLDMGYPAP